MTSSGGEALKDRAVVEIVDATDEEYRRVLGHLFELYVYDFSEYTGSDVHDSGSYEVVEKDYWCNEFPHRYIARVDGKIAGFALVRRGSPLDADALAAYVEEFFVLRKYRRRGVGAQLARHVFAQFPGRWQVAVLRNNLPPRPSGAIRSARSQTATSKSASGTTRTGAARCTFSIMRSARACLRIQPERDWGAAFHARRVPWR